LSSRAGTALLALVAERLGLTDGLCAALASTRERRSAHDPGRVLSDLAVMATDGGRCVPDLAALAERARGGVDLHGAQGAAVDRRGRAGADQGGAGAPVSGHGGLARRPSG
jgi:hypothetical protein